MYVCFVFIHYVFCFFNIWNSSPDSADSADRGEMVTGAATHTLPNTRRNLRMTRVFNKLPQTKGRNILNVCFFLDFFVIF